MNIHLTASIDIESALQEAIGQVGLTGLGPDGTSEYEVTDVAVATNGDNAFDIFVTVDRIEGKFVSKDDVAEIIANEVESLDVEVSLNLA